MGWDKSILTAPHITRLMSPAARAAEKVRTPEESLKLYEDGQEAELQKDIRAYLNLHGIVFINPAMNKKSPLLKGYPDFSFSYRGAACAVECKVGKNTLSADQNLMKEKMLDSKNKWRWVLARSVADVQALFREIDKETL